MYILFSSWFSRNRLYGTQHCEEYVFAHLDRLPQLGTRHPLKHGVHAEVLPDGKVRVQDVVLRTNAQRPTDAAHFPVYIAPCHEGTA